MHKLSSSLPMLPSCLNIPYEYSTKTTTTTFGASLPPSLPALASQESRFPVEFYNLSSSCAYNVVCYLEITASQPPPPTVYKHQKGGGREG